MKEPRMAAISMMAMCLLSQRCDQRSPVAPPAAPRPKLQATVAPATPPYPPPPPLAGEASQCVVRSFARHKGNWEVDVYEYDSAQHKLGGMQFDANGHIVRWDMSISHRTYTYDAQGNLYEELDWNGDKLDWGTRWRHRYEGKPLRLVATDVFDLSEPKQRNRPHSHARYTYVSGRVDLVIKERAFDTELYRYVWKDDRIVAQYGTLGALHWSSKVPYHAGRTYEYDAQGRLTKFTIDGMMPIGEGATADGTIDHVTTFHYDADGHLERMEGDGSGGDVAPEDADGKPDQLTLLSPPCDPIVKLVPHIFGFPELNLPSSVKPPLR